MKKLMFATALVASVAAFGAGEAGAMTAINAISFEGYQSGFQFTTGQTEKEEDGEGVKAAEYGYFCFEGDSDSSVVTNENPSAKRTAYFKDAANTNNYLALDTEGGTLWRSIQDVQRYSDGGEGFVYSNGTARAVAATGTYLDTLVQFTVTEDDAPATTASDKLAIWLGVSTNAQGEVTGTNLMVRAGYLDDNGSDSFVTPTDFILSTAEPIEAGKWYRLTVKAIGDVTACVAKNSDSYDAGYMGFEIYLDGVQLAATEATISTAYMEVATGSDEFAWLNETADADFITYLESKKVFPSLQGKVSAYALQGVGFQGTGAVDEIVWTEDNPFPAATVEFTLTYSGDSNVDTLGAVTYTTGEGEVLVDFAGGTTAQIPSGATVTISNNVTFATNYRFASLTTNTVEATTSLPYTFTMTEAIAVEITSEQIPAAYPDYINTTDATIKAKYEAWRDGVGCDDATASQYLNQFLLNVDEATTVGDTALTITEIKENATAGWDITIGCTVSGASLTGTVGETIVCNGYLAVSYTDDLTGTWTTENIAITAVDATAGTVTVNVNKSGAKFMKVSLTAAPQPAAGE